MSCSGFVYRYVKRNMIKAFWYELRGSDLYSRPLSDCSVPNKDRIITQNHSLPWVWLFRSG